MHAPGVMCAGGTPGRRCAAVAWMPKIGETTMLQAVTWCTRAKNFGPIACLRPHPKVPGEASQSMIKRLSSFLVRPCRLLSAPM